MNFFCSFIVWLIVNTVNKVTSRQSNNNSLEDSTKTHSFYLLITMLLPSNIIAFTKSLHLIPQGAEGYGFRLEIQVGNP